MPELLTHPSREELSAYSLGQLPQERAIVIDSHVSECEPCCKTIMGLASDDTFVGLLQEAKALPTEPTVSHNGETTGPRAVSPSVPEPLAQHPRYEILGLIGKGGMGDVYKARHRMMDRTVALKIIKRELTRNPEAVDRFHREVKAAAQLSHPNVVASYDAEQAGDVHFLAMEYVDGVDLSRMVKDRGALPVAEACDYIRQAAIGLQHAHERGMVHRDIKPHNLMVTASGTVKILDFGLASLAPSVQSNADTAEASSDLTVAGSIMGTPDFISPEQAGDARQADIRSDIYSLGSTLYFLLAGRPPFAEGSITQKLDSHAQVDPEPLESLRDDIPAELAAVVEKMVAKNADERHQTPAEVAEALESYSRAHESVQEQRPPQHIQPVQKRNRYFLPTAVVTLFMGAIVAAVVYYVQTNTGIVRVEVNDESLVVTLAGRTITMQDGNKKPIEIQAGEHKLIVRRSESDFEFETDAFQLRRNGEITFRVERLKGRVVVSKEGKPFKTRALPDISGDPDNQKTQPIAKSSNRRAALALAGVVLEQDFGQFRFDRCELISGEKYSRVPGLGGLMFVYYKDGTGSKIELSIQWFDNSKDLLTFFNSHLERQKLFKRREMEGAVIWSAGDNAHFWTDGKHLFIGMSSGAAIPPAMTKAYLAQIPSNAEKAHNAQSPAASQGSAKSKTTAFLIDAAKRGDLAAVEAALKVGVDPNGPANQLTALHWAVAQRLVDGKTIDPSPKIVERLIKAGADVNAKDYLGQTPLEWAAKYASPDIVKMLIKAGANVNAESRYGAVLQATKNVGVANLLIEAGADVNPGTTMPPLAEAAKDNNLAMVQLLIEKGAKVNDPKNPPLQLAGKPEVAKALLDAGADANLRNAKGETVLHLPNMYFPPEPETVKLLIEAGADVNAKTATGATPLHAAIQQRKLEIAKLLIAAGADVDAKDKQGDTPLAVAHAYLSWAHRTPSADNKPYEVAVQLLVDAGAKDDGRTRLQQAVAAGDLDKVKKLIAANADVNETGPRQITAVHLASEKGHTDILAALIEAGAKVDAVGPQRMRPLHLAANAETARLLIAKGAKINIGMPSPLYMATVKGKADVVRELLRNDANAKDSDCATMLNWATFAGHIEVVKVLLELRDAKALLEAKSIYSPLHIAASGSLGDMASPAGAQQRLDIAKLLVEKGADVNTRWGANVNPQSGAAPMIGTTPLMFASQKGEPAMVKFLLEKGADPEAADASGQTAFHFVAQRGHRSVAELLLKAGADVNAVTRDGKTPLDLAHDAAMKVLLIKNGGKTAIEVLKDS